MPNDFVKRRYFYCSTTDSTRHKGKRSAYFVEEMGGGNIVARITPIGLLPTITETHEIALYAIYANLSLVGDWAETKRGRHQRIRTIMGRNFEANGEN